MRSVSGGAGPSRRQCGAGRKFFPGAGRPLSQPDQQVRFTAAEYAIGHGTNGDGGRISAGVDVNPPFARPVGSVPVEGAGQAAHPWPRKGFLASGPPWNRYGTTRSGSGSACQ
jgi:hypothetical protein